MAPGFADALIFGTTGLRRARSVVEGAAVGAEKDPGFFAALRMTKERGESRIARSSALYEDPHLHPRPDRARRQRGARAESLSALAGDEVLGAGTGAVYFADQFAEVFGVGYEVDFGGVYDQ